MRLWIPFVIVLSGGAHNAATGAELRALPELQLIDLYRIDSDRAIDPSGLAICQNELLVVADNNDQNWYRLNPQPGKALRAEIIGTVPTANNTPDGDLTLGIAAKSTISSWFTDKTHDFEGIACDHDGTVYLLSEAWNDVLQIHGREATWLNTRMTSTLQSNGLFQKHNALAEGMVWESASTLLFGAEREHRGLIRWHRQSKQFEALKPADSTPPLNKQPQDFADLAIHHGRLYTLERNHHRVCERDLESFVSSRCWSFAKTLLAVDERYDDNDYGIAEGLAITDEHVFIVVDNNNKPRHGTTDRRPTLYRFKHP